MIIFQEDTKYFVFLHIPKNGGKYIRSTILNSNSNKVIKSYWGVEENLDLAHIPYMLKDKLINNNINYNFFTYSRNPYHRIISAFFYRNPDKNVNDFKNFIKNTLASYHFSLKFDNNMIHYYPQYLFVCNENLIIEKQITIYKFEELENPKLYNLTSFFDNKCIKIINKIYFKDFLTFNYEIIKKI